MNVEKFYQEINGDLNKTISRLGSKEFVEQFVLEFMDDKTFDNLCISYNNNDVENSFLYVHTLKGICANLGLSGLYHASSLLTEVLRKKTFDDSKELYDEVISEYNKIKIASKKAIE